MVVCAGKIESFKFAKSIGIGLVESAINLTKICLEQRPKEIVFIGTCGLYKDGNLLEIFETNSASNVEISKILELAYSPIEANLSVKSLENLKNVSYETKRANSSNFITTDEKIAYKFYDFGFFMENMEVFSVFSVANFFQIPYKAFLCATNFCNENAHRDFLKNHDEAKFNLEQFMKNKGYL